MLDDLPWLHGPAECLACGKEWMAVWPIGCADLECPGCGSTDTVRDGMPDYDDEGMR